jgi:hypothetical protein
VERVHFRFGIVLLLIIVSLGFQLAEPNGDIPRLITVALQGITLVAAVVASRAHVWVIRLSCAAAIVFVLGAFAAVLGSDGDFGSDSAHLISVLLVALAPPAIVSGLVKQYREHDLVTVQTMFGVLCLYLLIGMFFASGYFAIQELSNDGFFATGFGDASDFPYFSFTTLTTTGYGDLSPATDLGHSLVVSEQLIGQLYPVTVVALIVANMGTSSAGRRRRAAS